MADLLDVMSGALFGTLADLLDLVLGGGLVEVYGVRFLSMTGTDQVVSMIFLSLNQQ